MQYFGDGRGRLSPFPLPPLCCLVEAAGRDGGTLAAAPVTETVVFSLQRAEDYGPVEVISHWHPNLTINMVDDHTPWVKGSVPPPLDQCKDILGVPRLRGAAFRGWSCCPLFSEDQFRLLCGTGDCFSVVGVASTSPAASGSLPGGC